MVVESSYFSFHTDGALWDSSVLTGMVCFLIITSSHFFYSTAIQLCLVASGVLYLVSLVLKGSENVL